MTKPIRKLIIPNRAGDGKDEYGRWDASEEHLNYRRYGYPALKYTTHGPAFGVRSLRCLLPFLLPEAAVPQRCAAKHR